MPGSVTRELRDFAANHPAMRRLRGHLLSGYDVDNDIGSMLRDCLNHLLQATTKNTVFKGRGNGWRSCVTPPVNRGDEDIRHNDHHYVNINPIAISEDFTITSITSIDDLESSATMPPEEFVPAKSNLSLNELAGSAPVDDQKQVSNIKILDEDDGYSNLYNNPWCGLSSHQPALIAQFENTPIVRREKIFRGNGIIPFQVSMGSTYEARQNLHQQHL
ncbi:hypothetical protein ABW20_dc0105867 [Dactylellina cionopaga]|nr:hypothetical protein ABW20_dc0105867 [Dactylellina cionopaga]